jgi:hypothetical protein
MSDLSTKSMKIARRLMLAVVALAALVVATFWDDVSGPLRSRTRSKEPARLSSLGEFDKPVATPSVVDASVSDREATPGAESLVLPGRLTIAGPHEGAFQFEYATCGVPVQQLSVDSRVLSSEILSVEQGRFSLRPVPGARFLGVERFSVDGLLAETVESQMDLAAREPLLLAARWTLGMTLDVVDASTAHPVRNVALVRAADTTLGGALDVAVHPGAEGRERDILIQADSPLRLPSVADGAAVWVGASGYAWKLITLAPGGGSRRITLESAAELRIELPRDSPPFRTLRLRIADGGGKSLLEAIMPASALTQVFTGLVPGEVVASITAGGRGMEQKLAEQRLELSAARATTWTVSWPSAAFDTGELDLIARLRAPAARPQQPPTFELLHAGLVGSESAIVIATGALREDPGSGEWRAFLRDLLPGTYQVQIHSWGVQREVEVRPHERIRVEFDVEPSQRLRVEVVAAQSGDLIGHARVMYRAAESQSGMFSEARFEPQSEVWVIEGSSGLLTVSCSAVGFVSLKRDVPLGAGSAIQRFELEPSKDLRVRVSLTDDGTPFPIAIDDWTQLTIDRDASHGVLVRMNFEASLNGLARCASIELVVSNYGKYVLRVPPQVSGRRFEELLDFEVAESGPSEVVIQR